ncbi:calcineurin-like phosphoesterase C-terminal domain-containing protein [Sphingobacterium sp. lm-10]|uniref:calcineurin-like phosphoesterase C-terminal domain-containing protein n=1 Tax=Sphingobacterium sp. lm-10 TaxID=2944904 RepID=UPI002022240B|nr:calcineurin-like phosphoesterase C-terminal domain-containing protein [Sphingobacterium sp. lm-10]MCL7986991.1 calcineurin-like phosphoesterase C-terminal domain-containing protein [Sphingobacterium sp. lm-10]
MTISNLLLSVGLCLSLTAFAQDNISGVVYDDKNHNGKIDKGEIRLPNVAVSNGQEVVTTNSNGEYTLPVGDDNVIFVIKPSGYTFPLDSNNLHQFYYIHKPKGSPEALKYAGSSPTGKLPKSLDFALHQQDESKRFNLFVFGDPQTYTEEEVAYFKQGIIQDIKAKDHIAFGLSLGDLVGDDLSLHPDYQSAVAALNLPWFNVMGNHDMNYDVTVDSLSDETFEKNFGPANFSFNYGNAHFIILDNIIYPNPETGKGYTGGFREDQLTFLANDLKLVPKEKLIVIAYHIPLFLNDKSSSHFRSADRQRLMDLLAPFPNTLSLSAHTHFQTQVYFNKEDGWNREKPHHEYNVGTTSGDWYSGEMNEQGVPVSTMRDGTPKGYVTLHIDDNTYAFDYKVAGKPKEYQISLTGAEIMSEKYVRRHNLYANFFVGTEKDTVQYRVDGGQWKDMEYAEEADPDYAFETLKYDHAKETIKEGRRPSDAVPSTHLWKVRYPKLSVGMHQIEVRAVDMFGQEHRATKSVEITH